MASTAACSGIDFRSFFDRSRFALLAIQELIEESQ
jgi:hypothetical protein